MSAPELKQHPNGVWYVHWTEGRRTKRVSTGAKEMAGPNGARAFFGAWLLAEHEAPPEQADARLVRELWAPYFEKHIKFTASVGVTENSWKNLEPFFGDMLVIQVDDDAVAEYELLRAKGAIGRPSKATTVRRELGTLRACFNWCAHRKRKLLAKAAVPEFDLPPEGEPRDRWLRHDEVQRLLDAAAAKRGGDRLSRVERFLWIALETASRKTAICQLTWDRVDFEAGVIFFDVPGRRKTKKRRSAPPISNALRPVLERAFAERLDKTRTDGLVMDFASDMYDPVFTVARRAGVAGVSPHVLRHTAATHMARRGVPLWKIAGVLGNSMDMVEKVYAKHCPDGLVDAVNSISGGNLEAAE